MKCFLCSLKFDDKSKLIEHYINYHNIDENNYFFKQLINLKNKSYLKKCLQCDEFLITKKEKAQHDFLKHYNLGNEVPFEEKPIDIIIYPALTIYKIEYKKNNRQYSFDNSEKCIDTFLRNVKNRFRATNKKWFKCSFTTENTQNAYSNDFQALTNTRYWTTETYDSIYFNDFILYSLKADILKRVIINQTSGSSWYFKRFLNLALKVLDSTGLDLTQ